MNITNKLVKRALFKMKVQATITLIMLVSSMALSQTKTLVFQISLNMDFEAIDPQDEIDLETTELSPEEIKEVHEKRKKEIAFWTKKFKDEEKRRYYYTIGEKNLRYIRPVIKPGLFFEEEFILINREDRIMNQHFINKEGRAELTQFPMDRSSFRPIKVDYQVDTFGDDRKTIHGYDCYRIVVKESIVDEEFGIDRLEYDMYVTDKIDLPFHLLNTTLKPVLNSCPLEMTIYKKEGGSTFSTMNVVEIINNVNQDLVELPDRFKGE